MFIYLIDAGGLTIETAAASAQTQTIAALVILLTVLLIRTFAGRVKLGRGQAK